MLVSSLNLLLLNEAFQVGAQPGHEEVSNIGYYIAAIMALGAALAYLFKRYEAVTERFNEERERTFKEIGGMIREATGAIKESAEAKNRLSSSIDNLNRDSQDRHRATMQMLEHINSKT
jgi:hypothetical protein